jgi:biopolymer transport protein ExbD
VIINAQKQRAGQRSIELTPVIDMVFLLLIFFLVATTFQQSEREMQIALPEAEAAGPISAVPARDRDQHRCGRDRSLWWAARRLLSTACARSLSDAVERNPESEGFGSW